MKKIIIILLLTAVTALSAPLALNQKNALPAAARVAKEKDAESVVLLNTATDKKTKVSVKDYLFCVVASEMPALYETEALKAQAVAAYTYMLYKKDFNKNKSYDITSDSATDQAYTEKKQILSRWGDNADKYEEKITKAVNAVYGKAITYNGKPILAVYHAVSSGKTSTAKSVWGGNYPYLKQVDSSWDALSGEYTKQTAFTKEEFCNALNGETEFCGEAENYIENKNCQANKYVKSITLCGKEITGAKMRSLLKLRSTCFDIEFNGESFIITTYGYGHNVGLSQYGADYMAKQGSNYKEILNHYYKNCKVETLKTDYA